MGEITMNPWVTEKAMRQAEACCRLRSLVANMPDYFQRESAEDLVYRLYYSSCVFLAYSAGNLDQDLTTAIMGAYSEGPEGMRELAKALAAEKPRPGWQLPNPQFHSLVVNVERSEG